jgi:hypothetical protein
VFNGFLDKKMPAFPARAEELLSILLNATHACGDDDAGDSTYELARDAEIAFKEHILGLLHDEVPNKFGGPL